MHSTLPSGACRCAAACLPARPPACLPACLPHLPNRALTHPPPLSSPPSLALPPPCSLPPASDPLLQHNHNERRSTQTRLRTSCPWCSRASSMRRSFRAPSGDSRPRRQTQAEAGGQAGAASCWLAAEGASSGFRKADIQLSSKTTGSLPLLAGSQHALRVLLVPCP